MRAKAAFLILLICMIGFTGFGKSTAADLVQNSKPDLVENQTVSVVNLSIEIALTGEIVSCKTIIFNAGDSVVKNNDNRLKSLITLEMLEVDIGTIKTAKEIKYNTKLYRRSRDGLRC